MAQQHMDIVKQRDASFLAQERSGTHMHVGAVAVFEVHTAVR